jgi:RHS repeat-associated protein
MPSSPSGTVIRYSPARILVVFVAICGAAGLILSCQSTPPKDNATRIARALAEPSWSPGTTYRVGDLIQYGGIVYECRADHTSAVGWEPPNALSLWQRPTPIGPGPAPWAVQVHYVVGSDVSYAGSLWECTMEHVSQSDWFPGAATPPVLWRKAKTGPTACQGLADGSLCDDGVSCNVDICQGGACKGSGQTCGGSIVPTTEAVGTIPGSLGVTSSGTAMYTIPLWTPEGRNGMTPNLALSYSSAAGDSFVGQGWNLSGGMSMVAKCGADAPTDERPAPVTATSKLYCLDGQRLMRTSGTDGGDGSEYKTQPDTFTKVIISGEDVMGPRVFKVYTPDGLIHTYGTSAAEDDLRYQIQGEIDEWIADDSKRTDDRVTQRLTKKPIRSAWLRRTVADRYGNTIWFSYTNEGVTTNVHEALLDTIEYVDTAMFKSRLIKFTYQTASDPFSQRFGFRSGQKFARTKVLESIAMQVAPPNSTTRKTVKFYKLATTPAQFTRRPRLDSVQECDGSTVSAKCKNPTVFTYQPGSLNHVKVVVPQDPDLQYPAAYAAVYPTDLDQDGRTDVLLRALPAGAPATDPPRWYARLSSGSGNGVTLGPAFEVGIPPNSFTGDPVIVDLNSDGFPDLAVPSGPKTYDFYRNNRLADGAPFELITTSEVGSANRGIQVGDFSGRGKVSVLRPMGLNNTWTYAAFHVECAPGYPCTTEQSAFSGPLGVKFDSNPLDGWNTFGLDIDGDRVPNLLARGGSLVNHLVSVNQEHVPSGGADAADWGATTPTTLLASQQDDLIKYLFLDQNGDGLKDAIRLRKDGAVPSLIINSGNGFAPPQVMSHLAGTVGNIALGPGTNHKDLNDVGARILDFDGDGRDDILLVDDGAKRDSTAVTNPGTRSKMVVLLSRGSGFQVKQLDGTNGLGDMDIGAPADGFEPPDSSKVRNYRSTVVGDFNGDRLPDVLVYTLSSSSSVVPPPIIYTHQGTTADLLIGITDGMGKTTTVTYKPMTDSSVYDKAGVCNATPLGEKSVKCEGNRILVSSLTSDNGVGQNSFTYKYKSLSYDTQARALIGFQEWTVTDSATNTTTTESFEVSEPDTLLDPMTGLPVLDPTTGLPVLELFGHVGQPDTRVVTTAGTDVNGIAFTRTTRTDFGYELVSTPWSYFTRSTGQITYLSESKTGKPLESFASTTFSTPVYSDTLTPFGLSEGVTIMTCDGSSPTVCPKPFIDISLADYVNFPDSPSPSAEPWLIGLKTSDIQCSVTPADNVNPATVIDGCKNGSLPRRLRTFIPDPNTGAVLMMKVQPDRGIDERLEVAYTRDETPYGLVTKVTSSAVLDPALAPRVDRVGYDAQFVHATSYTNGLNQTTSSTIDPGLGTVLTTTDPNNVTSSFDYDTYGRVRRANPPGGGGASVTYARDTVDPSLIVTTTLVDGGGESRSFVNRVGQQVRSEERNFDGSFIFTRQTYNALGLLETSTTPRKLGTPAGALSSWSYDVLGRATQVVRPEEAVDSVGGPITSASVKSHHGGRVTTITNEAQHQTRYTSDLLGRVIKSEAQNDLLQWVPTEYTYGAFGELSFVNRRDGAGAPAAGRVTELQYDSLGRRTVLIDPDTGKRVRSYNAFGEVRDETDAQPAKTTYVPDVLGRVATKMDKDGLTTFTWDTATNGIGKLAQTMSPSGVKRQFFYDSNGRMYRELWTVDNVKYQLDYAFDPISGRISKVTYPETPGSTRLAVKNSYDSNSGRLSKVEKEGATKPYWNLAATEVDGTVKQEVFGNDVATNYTSSLVTGRLMGIASTKAGSSLRQWQYAYLPDGNLQRRSNLKDSQHERFEYDNLDRIRRWAAADVKGKPLSGGWSVNYNIDDFGSLVDRNFVAGSTTGGTSQNAHFTVDPNSHRVTASSLWSGTYSYDANGNQTGRPDNETVVYTAFDLPKKITGSRPADFSYDASGVRAKKQKSTTNYTIYVAGLYEKRVNGSSKEHVFYVMGPRGPVAQVTRPEGASEETRYLHSDRLGSMDTVTSSGGTVLESTKRDPYGNAFTNFNQPKLPTGITASANKVRLGFTGHEQDDELGMINMRGRMFDPRLGRFLTPDPHLGVPLRGLSFNRYSYVANNPLRSIDPTGFDEAMPPSGSLGPGYHWVYVNGTWIIDCYRPDLCAEDAVVIVQPPLNDTTSGVSVGTSGGGDGAGSGGAGGAGGGGADTGHGGSGGSTAPSPPPQRTRPQDCTQPCSSGHSAQGGKPAHISLRPEPGLSHALYFLQCITIGCGAANAPGPETPTYTSGWSEAGDTLPLIVGSVRSPRATRGPGTGVGPGAAHVSEIVSSNAARREVMRQAGIPTSQQPVSQSRNASGLSYEYDVAQPGGGAVRMSVQQQTRDRSHPGQGHWEAGPVKLDPLTGAVRYNDYGWPKLTSEKSKVDYCE